jgi:hypothetical protein
MFRNIYVFLSKVDRDVLAPARERRNHDEPPRRRTTRNSFFSVWLSSAMPANENEAHSFLKNELGQKLFQNICVFLLNVELQKLAPRPQRCDMYEPPRRRIKLLGRRGRQVQRFKYL